MKKHFTLLALAAAMTFAACSSDDGPAAWEKLPATPISGENAVLTVNGDATAGTVQLTATSATQGTLLLTNVLPGYDEVSMAVTLAERADGSFDLQGETGLTTPPSMLAKAEAAAEIFHLTVSGSLTPEGKAVIDLTSALSTEAQGGLTGTWNLLDKMSFDEDSNLTSAPLWITWNAIDPAQPNAEQLALTLRTFGSPLLYQVLHSVTFAPDGNITAQYWSGEPDLMSCIFYGIDEAGNIVNLHESEPWLDSPKNLAFWFVRGDRLYIVPNIAAILAETGGENGAAVDPEALTGLLGTLAEYGVKVDLLLPLVQQWMQTGIPLRYAKENGALKLYADKELCAPVIEALLPALPKLDKVIAKLVAENPDDEMIQMLPMLFFMLGIENFAALEPVWNSNTADFEIALHLTEKAQ